MQESLCGPPPMTKFHQSLKFRLYGFVLLVLLGIIAVIHSVVYVASRNFFDNEITLTAQAVATAVALHIMGDENIEAYTAFLAFVDEYKESQGAGPGEPAEEPMPQEFLEQGGEHFLFYQRMARHFEGVMERNRIVYIYTIRRLCDEYVEYILDGAEIGDEDHWSAPADIEYNEPVVRRVYTTGEPDRFGLNHYTNWSHLLGAYVPIFDKNGEIVGLLGVNICGTHLHNFLNRKQLILLAIYVCIICLALLVLSQYSNAILEPLVKDKLTGAFTKRYADKLIQDEMVFAAKSHKGLTLMVIDLDHFKKINDTFGHHFGDTVLTAVSEVIQNVLRQKDYFIRYGGEEFIALVPETDEKRAMMIAERIRANVEQTDIVNTERNVVVNMTISIGVSTLGLSPADASEFIDQADKALYVAKKTRNSVSLYVHETEKVFEDTEEYRSYVLSSAKRQ